MPAIYDTFDRIHGRILIHICCGTLFVRAAQHTGQSDLDENPRAARPEHYLHSAAATNSFFLEREKQSGTRGRCPKCTAAGCNDCYGPTETAEPGPRDLSFMASIEVDREARIPNSSMHPCHEIREKSKEWQRGVWLHLPVLHSLLPGESERSMRQGTSMCLQILANETRHEHVSPNPRKCSQ
jgi:hypothetical protein